MFTTLPTGTDRPHPLRILYAEDVRELRDLVRLVVTHDGSDFESAIDGVDALEKLSAARDPFDLLITDHHMPRMDGLELVQQARRMQFGGRIMVFSSELTAQAIDTYRQLAVDRIVFKPVYPSFLRQVIGELFTAERAAPA